MTARPSGDVDVVTDLLDVSAFDVEDAVAQLRKIHRAAPGTSTVLVSLRIANPPADRRRRTRLRRWCVRCWIAGVLVFTTDSPTLEALCDEDHMRTRIVPEVLQALFAGIQAASSDPAHTSGRFRRRPLSKLCKHKSAKLLALGR